MEYDRALAIAARRVPTVVPLACGERCDGSGPCDSYLITQTLDDTIPLDLFLTGHFARVPSEQRQEATRTLAQFLARLHAAGVLHRDLHCGNILVRPQPDGRVALYLIDLQAVRLSRPLDWPNSRANLVLFNNWLATQTSRTERLRFWHAYCEARHDIDGLTFTGQPFTLAQRDWLHFRALELERQTRLAHERFWRHRDARCLERNRRYRRVRTTGVVGHAVAELQAQDIRELLRDPDEPFRRVGANLLKDSRSSTVTELTLPVGGVSRPLIYKRFRVTARSDPWANRVRRSSALRSWVFGHGLCERHLPTARPLLVLHRRRRGLYAEGYLLAEKITSATDLHGCVATGASLPLPVWRRRIEQLAKLIRTLHRRHLAHRDLKASNILFREASQVDAAAQPTASNEITGAAGDAPFWFIDLVGVSRHKRVARPRRIQNLTRLNASFWASPVVSRTDRLRFLRVYLQWGLLGRQGWKSWWRQISEATQQKIAKNARNGRPLA